MYPTHYLNIRLKLLIFFAVTFISAIPVLILGYWVQDTALKKEIEAVEEKHLIIAQNLSLALGRYVKDTKTAFSHFGMMAHHHAHDEGSFDKNIESLLGPMDISSVCLIEENSILKYPIVKDSIACPFNLSQEKINLFREMALGKDDHVFISDIDRVNDRPVFFIGYLTSSGALLIGTLEPSYLIEVQRSIAFGKHGHSMMVDATGRVIAHPTAEWESSSKDVSRLPVVQKMMLGETGVTLFFSPAKQANMIAGYTSVPGVGWGVMVPQPLSELVEHAEDVQSIALVITLLGLALAILLGWLAARILSIPMEIINRTALDVAGGNVDARVTEMPRYTAREVINLSTSFNQMLDWLNESHNELKQHRDNLERIVADRTNKLEQEVLMRKNAETVLQQQKENLDVTLASIGDGVITTDNNCGIQYLNPVAEKLIGQPLQHVIGQSLENVLKTKDPETGQGIDTLRCCDDQSHCTFDSVLVKDGEPDVYIQMSVAKIKDQDDGVIGLVIVIRDVTENRRLSNRLIYEASHDSLTGLVNRREFENRVHALASQDGEIHSLCFLDLDQFKIINDTFGHQAGDQLLQSISGIIQNCMRKADTLSRLGGDEFGILLTRCPLSKAVEIAEMIREQVQEFRFYYNGQYSHIGVSIGVVEISGATSNLADIFKAADSACFAAKEKGRNKVHAYRPTDEDIVFREGEVKWVNRLHKAIEQELLVLYLQPIIPLDGRGGVKHYELLLRLQDGEKLIYPDVFLPAAERYSLLGKIDQWVFKNAVQWLGKNYSILNGGRLSINLSGVTLSDNAFLEFAQQQLQLNHINADNMIIEITERSALNNLASAKSFIAAMRGLGCEFALDDFGCGFSSFGNLKHLPIHYIKIDGEFVRDILTDSIDEAMVKTINDIGHLMGKSVVAEYVESAELLEKLKTMGVDYGQGFAIQEPFPLIEFERVLQKI